MFDGVLTSTSTPYVYYNFFEYNKLLRSEALEVSIHWKLCFEKKYSYCSSIFPKQFDLPVKQNLASVLPLIIKILQTKKVSCDHNNYSRSKT